MMTGYNDTYESTHYKYTINLPIGLVQEARVKSQAAGYAELAPYIRHVILREVREGSLNIQDILGQKEVRRREYLTKHRRRMDSIPVKTNSLKEFSCKIKKLMVCFKRSRDQQFFEF